MASTNAQAPAAPARSASARTALGRLAPVLLAGGALAAAAAPAAVAAPPAAHAKAAKVKTARLVYEGGVKKLGVVLVDAKAMTLYHFTLDKSGKIACVGKCVTIWPPLVLPKGTTSVVGGKGVTGLGTVKNPEGQMQVTYHGEPLYTFSGDKKRGEANGEGFLGKWYAIVVKSAAGAKTTTTKSTGY